MCNLGRWFFAPQAAAYGKASVPAVFGTWSGFGKHVLFALKRHPSWLSRFSNGFSHTRHNRCDNISSQITGTLTYLIVEIMSLKRITKIKIVCKQIIIQQIHRMQTYAWWLHNLMGLQIPQAKACVQGNNVIRVTSIRGMHWPLVASRAMATQLCASTVVASVIMQMFKGHHTRLTRITCTTQVHLHEINMVYTEWLQCTSSHSWSPRHSNMCWLSCIHRGHI